MAQAREQVHEPPTPTLTVTLTPTPTTTLALALTQNTNPAPWRRAEFAEPLDAFVQHEHCEHSH